MQATDLEIQIEVRWSEYLEKSKNYGARRLVQRFVHYLKVNNKLDKSMHVVDIGCGTGGDTCLYGISEGLNVTALDYNPKAIGIVAEKTKDYKNVTTIVSDITSTQIPLCNIASASLTMQFIPPDIFGDIWSNNITANIAPSGYFVGHFLGVEDGWAKDYSDRMPFFTKDQVQALFAINTSNFNGPLFFKEKKKFSNDMNGSNKYWHIFTVFAQKKSCHVDKNNSDVEDAIEISMQKNSHGH